VKMSDEQRRTRRNADDNQSSVIIDRRAGDGGKSFFSFSSSPLFTLTTIIEILLSRSMRASRAKHKQNINFLFCCMYVCYSHFCFISLLLSIYISFSLSLSLLDL
jgi:hypothetical protein